VDDEALVEDVSADDVLVPADRDDVVVVSVLSDDVVGSVVPVSAVVLVAVGSGAVVGAGGGVVVGAVVDDRTGAWVCTTRGGADDDEAGVYPGETA
jgi:hypothetical protein